MLLSTLPISNIILGSIIIIIFISLYLMHGFYDVYKKTNKLLLDDINNDVVVTKNSRKIIIASFVVYWMLVLPMLGYMIMIYVTLS